MHNLVSIFSVAVRIHSDKESARLILKPQVWLSAAAVQSCLAQPKHWPETSRAPSLFGDYAFHGPHVQSNRGARRVSNTATLRLHI